MSADYNPSKHLTKNMSASSLSAAGYPADWRNRNRFHPFGTERGAQGAQAAVSNLTAAWELDLHGDNMPKNDGQLDERLETLCEDVDKTIEILLEWRKRMMNSYRCVP